MKPKIQDLCKEKNVQMTPICRKETCGCCFLSVVNTPFPANSIGASVGFVLPALVPGVLSCQEGLGTSGILQVGTARGLHATRFYQSAAWCRNGALRWASGHCKISQEKKVTRESFGPFRWISSALPEHTDEMTTLMCLDACLVTAVRRPKPGAVGKLLPPVQRMRIAYV